MNWLSKWKIIDKLKRRMRLFFNRDEGSSATVQIATAITEVAGGTEKQADSVNETVSAIEQITASIQMVAEASQTVTALTTQTVLKTNC